MHNSKIDHLFRHQFGKMVSILTKVFGFQHLETIEDAVQDTFIQAMRTWSKGMPDNPEAWLTTAAKNRVIDIFRSINAQKARSTLISNPLYDFPLEDLFLETEIEDSQLRMIFTACHPALDAKLQIAFALKTISGFSIKEIASAMLTQNDTIKKRLQRARKTITEEKLAFEIPQGNDLPKRLDRVYEVIYVIFNEGFHSNKKDLLVRKDLCGEAIRLCKLLLTQKNLRQPKTYALFALLCFHSARLDSKVNENNELITLDKQDRSLWYFPLIALGNDAMNKAVIDIDNFSSYHYEAAIASEHLRAPNFESTNWKMIAQWYEQLNHLQPHPNIKLNLSISYLKMNKLLKAYNTLITINPKLLVQKDYLYFATLAEYYHLSKDASLAIENLDKALEKVSNKSEYNYLESKRSRYTSL